MRIDGLTCCVGAMYAEQLARALPIWLDTLDTLTIVTQPNDPALALSGANLRHVTTDVFTRYGAWLNKGAALNELFAAVDPSEWVLHVDSDIVPPQNWRSLAEQRANAGALWGAPRYSESGRRMDARLYPWGYFHLWHTQDMRTWRWPLFENFHAHAGNYDANFADLWPKLLRRDLGFNVRHQGERQTNWFGPRDANKTRMRQLRSKGLGRVRTPAGNDPLPLPEPRFRFALAGHVDWLRGALRICRQGSQFDVHAKILAAPPPGWERLDDTVPLRAVRERMLVPA